MSAPVCYVMQAADWDQFTQFIGLVVLFLVVAPWVLNIDLWWWIDRYRIERRRRRLRAIREARAHA